MFSRHYVSETNSGIVYGPCPSAACSSAQVAPQLVLVATSLAVGKIDRDGADTGSKRRRRELCGEFEGRCARYSS